jgi:hypothetical protein
MRLPVMTRRVRPTDLRAGDEVVGDGDEPAFVVHGVEQLQGQVQVTDTAGSTHTFPATGTVEIA